MADVTRYVSTALPAGMAGVFALACKECGVLVLDAEHHDRWHAQQDGGQKISGAQIKVQCESTWNGVECQLPKGHAPGHAGRSTESGERFTW